MMRLLLPSRVLLIIFVDDETVQVLFEKEVNVNIKKPHEYYKGTTVPRSSSDVAMASANNANVQTQACYDLTSYNPYVKQMLFTYLEVQMRNALTDTRQSMWEISPSPLPTYLEVSPLYYDTVNIAQHSYCKRPLKADDQYWPQRLNIGDRASTEIVGKVSQWCPNITPSRNLIPISKTRAGCQGQNRILYIKGEVKGRISH